MKKVSFIIVILAVLSFGLTSCNKDVEKCWKVDVSIKFELMETSVTNYIWATENELESLLEDLKSEYAEYPDVRITIKKSATRIKTEEDCDDKNEPVFDY